MIFILNLPPEGGRQPRSEAKGAARGGTTEGARLAPREVRRYPLVLPQIIQNSELMQHTYIKSVDRVERSQVWKKLWLIQERQI